LRGNTAASVVLLIGLCASGWSQDPLHRDSPQSSVVGFLEACHAKDYRRSWRFLDLRKIPTAQWVKEGVQVSQQLEHILDHDTQFDVAALSKNPAGDGSRASNRELVASFTEGGKTRQLELERITLRSGVSIWLFSSESVDLIPQLARGFTESPIEKHLPDPLVNWKLLDTPLWRWIALALLAAALVVLSRLLLRLLLLLMEPLMKRFESRVPSGRLHEPSGPFRLLLIVAGFRAGMEWIGPSTSLRLILDRGLALLFFFALAWLLMKVSDLAIGRLRTKMQAKHHAFAHSFLPLTSRVLKILIFLLAIATVLANWGYNTTTILAGLGVGGLAIALAAQKTIENLFGGVAVIADRPVNVGDFCKFGDRVGTVEDIGLRSTRIRTLDRTLVTVPNAQFSSMTLENFAKRDKMWFHFTLNLRRDTTPDQVRDLLKSIARKLGDHPKAETGPLPVRFTGVGAYSLDLEVFAYISTRDSDEFMRIQQELLLWILDEVEGVGTSLALPTQVSYPLERAPAANGGSAREEAAAGPRQTAGRLR
jgi:MscS family membrane protein